MLIKINEILGINSQEDHLVLSSNWPGKPDHVHYLISTRKGGFSQGSFDSLNLALHVEDNTQHVRQNRALIQSLVSHPISYLNQIHSTKVAKAIDSIDKIVTADASFDCTGRVACAVLTADCLPILLCNKKGTEVAAIHAGWRGLANGIVHQTIQSFSSPKSEIMAYLGPAISQHAFEVGHDVYSSFSNLFQPTDVQQYFRPIGDNKYLADIYELAKIALNQEGIKSIHGGTHCTVIEKNLFYSYRRDGQTGRMASIIWFTPLADK